MISRQYWTLNKLLVLLLTLGCAMLVVDIRYEHVDVLGRHRAAWIPIIYSGIMFLAGIAGLAVWDRGGRQFLQAAFAAALVVGLLGYWFHTHGHILTGVKTVLEARASVPHKKKHTPPPPFAPLSYLGLGLVGMLACAGAYQPKRETN